MDKAVKRYYALKARQKEIERELAELRERIIGLCAEQELTETEVGGYRVKLVGQDRREYDDRKLYEALPDADVWRLLSKADASKITGLVKLNVISEEMLQGTYTMKKVTSLQVDKK